VGLWSFIVRRLMLAVIVLVMVSTGTFFLAQAAPGDPVETLLGDRSAGNPEIRAAAEKRYGFDKPIPVQFVTYIKNLFQGDLGESISTRRPVMTDLRQFVPGTLELTLAAMFFSLGVGIPLGILAAVKRDRWPDLVARLVALSGTSVPVFWLSLLLLYLFFFKLHWLPGPGRIDIGMEQPHKVTGLITVDAIIAGDWQALWSAIKHLILPAVALGSFSMGMIVRMLRSSLLASLNDDYVRTARAKGLAERTVITRHALRNAMIPTVTVIGLTTASLLAGAVLTETIFSWPGIGRYGVDAARKLDYPALFGVTLIVAVAYVSVSLVVDIIYALLDPRIRVQ
jgi:peptide/nickel transport system permease protein